MVNDIQELEELMKKLIITAFIILSGILANAGVIYEAKIEVELYNQQEMPEDNPATGMIEEMTKPYTMKAMMEQDGRGRVKFTSDGPMMFKKGTFLVAENKDVVYFCDPESKSYSKFNIGNANKQLSGLAAKMQKFTKMKYKNIAVTIAEIGDGGNVAGYPTKKYKLVVEYDTEMKILFKKVKDHQKQEYIIYATNKLPFDLIGEYSNSQMFTTGIEGIDNQIKTKVAKVGFPLKIETLSYDKNNTLTAKHTFTITSLKEKNLNPALFKVPNGYTEQEVEVEGQDEEGNTKKQKLKFGDLFK